MLCVCLFFAGSLKSFYARGIDLTTVSPKKKKGREEELIPF